MSSVLDACRRFADTHPVDAARALEGLSPDEAGALLHADHRLAVTILPAMIPMAAADCLGIMPARAAAEIARHLRPSHTADLLRRLRPDLRAALLEELPVEYAESLRRLLRVKEGTAGALLDPRVLALPQEITVAEAVRRVRRSAGDMLYYLYVVDRDHRLTGVLDVRELLMARRGLRLSAVMRTAVASLRASADRAVILSHPAWRSVHAIPVLDEDGVLVGAIRYQTLRRLEAQDSAEDRRREPMITARALGELYWLGLTGMLESLAATAAPVDSLSGGRPPAAGRAK